MDKTPSLYITFQYFAAEHIHSAYFEFNEGLPDFGAPDLGRLRIQNGPRSCKFSIKPEISVRTTLPEAESIHHGK